MVINEHTIAEINELVAVALRAYETEVALAYSRAKKGLRIGLVLEFSPAKGGGIQPAVTINFVAEKIKEKFTGNVVDSKQLSLGYPVEDEG